jgi:hypothetical protein
VVEYSTASASTFIAPSQAELLAEEILPALEEAPRGLTRTGVRDLFNRNRGGDEINAALSLLNARGLAEMRRERGASFNPVERWFATRQQSLPSKSPPTSPHHSASANEPEPLSAPEGPTATGDPSAAPELNEPPG